MLVKQIVRRVAGWRGIGDYPGTSSYSAARAGQERVRRIDAAHRASDVSDEPTAASFTITKASTGVSLRALSREVRARPHADLTLQLDGPAPGHAGVVRGARRAREAAVEAASRRRRVRTFAKSGGTRWISSPRCCCSTCGRRTRELVDATEVRPAMTRRLTRLPLVGIDGDRRHGGPDPQPRLGLPAMASRRESPTSISFTSSTTATRTWRGSCRRAGSLITCHDLDAFRGVLPGSDGGSMVERALGRRLLEGMQAARKILCGSAATRDAAGRVGGRFPPTASSWCHTACIRRAVREPMPGADREAASLLGPPDGDRVELLHVGSTIPRKRIDVLLQVVAALCAARSATSG